MARSSVAIAILVVAGMPAMVVPMVVLDHELQETRYAMLSKAHRFPAQDGGMRRVGTPPGAVSGCRLRDIRAPCRLAT